MVYVDGMQGIIKHHRTIQWLYVLITKYGNKVRTLPLLLLKSLLNHRVLHLLYIFPESPSTERDLEGVYGGETQQLIGRAFV